MTRPRIAVAPCQRLDDYLHSVTAGGGDAHVLDGRRDEPDAVIRRAHGLLLTGGADVDPALYGEAPHTTCERCEPGRDAYEIALVRAAFHAELPIFAICRGMQVLNVALGGTLVQDIPSEMPAAVEHARDDSKVALAHDVQVDASSQLARVLGSLVVDGACAVNSRHHQSIRALAPGWHVSASAPDGVLEAIETVGRSFRIAVQWHPENFWRTGEFLPLFAAFVHAAGTRMR